MLTLWRLIPVVYLFPTVQCLICLGAAGVYGYQRFWLHSVYWVAAAVITAVVTLMR